ncbi:hypothetical protein [Microcoleus sp. herbarium14]|uniref:hypothetical protein n=1 Tax=Microcoleus sp. herbarium14 TaxID=3055439 RepID=UPI002FD1EBD8
MTTSKPTSPRLADLNREDAEEVTRLIKQNFDSLGDMLLTARDRKAYKVLGYRSFETYCQTEFGKSSSTAYQAIEDAKVRSQLEAHVSENYGQEVTLDFPSSHLRPLKAVEGLDNKLKVIEHAQKLAAGEGKKATKQHLEIAIFEISGKRSEDFRSAIQKLGFTQGAHVQTLPPHKKERGIVRKIDKLGKIHVELFYGGIKRIEYSATQLRILTNEEKPANPLEGSIAKKGDRVLIYAEGLQGKQGTIYTWNESKQALVMVDGETSPNLIAYAEMERIKPERKDTNWEADLSWNTTKQTYYYFQKEDLIYSNKWPAGLTLTPHSHELSPIDFIANWEDKFAGEVLEALATPAIIKTLVLRQAIELPEDEGKEFVADLIVGLLQLFPQSIPESPSILVEANQRLAEVEVDRDNLLIRIAEAQNRYTKIREQEVEPLENRLIEFDSKLVATEKELRAAKKELTLEFEYSQRGILQQEISKLALANEDLREQLAKAEVAIQAMVNALSSTSPLASPEIPEFSTENTANKSTPGDTTAYTDFLVENAAEISTPGDTAAPTDFLLGDAASTASVAEPEQTAEFLVENTSTSLTSTSLFESQTWLEVLDSNSFTQGYIQLEELNEESTEAYRGWNIFTYDSSVADISHPIKGIFSIDFSWAFEKSIINRLEWLKNIINQVEDFCPGQLSLFSAPIPTAHEIENVVEISTPGDAAAHSDPTTIQAPKQDISAVISAKRASIEKELEQATQELLQTKAEKKIKKTRTNIRILESQLEDVDKFVAFEVGDVVIRNIFPDKKGIVDRLEISTTGMLTAWVIWPQEYEGEPNSPEEHNIGTLTNLSSVDSGEK